MLAEKGDIEERRGINLRSASLCLDCEEIYMRTNFNTGCPACGSKQSAPLIRFIKSILKPVERVVRNINGKGN